MKEYGFTIIYILMVLLFSQNVLAEADARNIMEKVDDRDDGFSTIATTTMVLIDNKGKKRTRTMKVFSEDVNDSVSNTANIFFNSKRCKKHCFFDI